MKKTWALLAAVLAVSGLCPAEVLADQEISQVVLEFESDLAIGSMCNENDIRITVKRGDCYVGDVQILNKIQRWEQGTLPRLSVYLHSEDENYFSLKRDDITIEGGTYESGRLVSPNLVELTVTLPSMTGVLGTFTDIGWNSATEAGWNHVDNREYYEVRLFCDGKAVGDIERTKAPQIDFGSRMQKAGTYSYRVRAVNGRDEKVKSQWTESGEVSYIDEKTAEELRSRYGRQIPEGAAEPSQVKWQNYRPDEYGWIQDKTGWWYRNEDGSYTAANWQLIDGKWYYFNSSGYMVTGWIDWNEKSYYCDPENGDMQVSKMIQDGSGRRVDSTGAWIQ